MPPDHPTLWRALHAILQPLWKFGRTGIFLLPMAWCDMQHIRSSAQDVEPLLPGSVVPVVI